MTATRTEGPAPSIHQGADPPTSSDRGRVAYLAMIPAIFAVALLPFLGDRRFYLADDTSGAWLPVSRRIGELVRAGESHLMDPAMWRGGNFVASARYGVWNPMALALDTTVLQIDDLALAMLLVCLLYLLVLASGCFLLAREYGADPWPSALCGVVAATGGWTLWLDATWWPPHLASLALTPFVWIYARRLVQGRGSPAPFILSAALCLTAGNPYSVIVIAVIALAVVTESDRQVIRSPRGLLVGSLVAIALISFFVYLPFQQTSAVGFRESGVFNDESWSPGAGDLLTMSSPTATPFVRHFGRDILEFPAMYLSWFALPLTPWLRWRRLMRRRYVGLGVFASVFLVLCLGPSNLWFFRWPMRLLPYLYLPIVIGLAIAVSAGLHRDRLRLRSSTSAAIVAASAYLTWADVPDDWVWHLIGGAVVLAATAVSVIVALRRPSALAPTLGAATLVVLSMQLQWQPVNGSVSSYGLPTTASHYENSFAGRYTGTIMQVASSDRIPPAERRDDGAFNDLTIGSTYAIAGLESLSAYSAIGFTVHDAALCIGFDGRTCPAAFDRLFQRVDGGDDLLVDLIRADTVVVQRTLIDTVDTDEPRGWRIAEVTDHAVVWKRRAALEWPQARLADVAGPATITDARILSPHRETVRFERTGEGEIRMTFARLVWPGYEATIDGRPLPIVDGRAGLVTVEVPGDIDGGDVVLTWAPPYWRPSLLVLVLGLATGAAMQLLFLRSKKVSPAPSDVALGPESPA